MLKSVKEYIFFVTVEENEDQFLRTNGKPPTATKSNKNCTMSFTISMRQKKGYTTFSGIMNKISPKVGGCSLQIKDSISWCTVKKNF